MQPLSERGTQLIQEAEASTKGYAEKIEGFRSKCLTQTRPLEGATLYTGKVRDRYDFADKVVLVSTDRLSAFDRQLASIPFKGQVLNQASLWWFRQTEHITPNHIISSPDPNCIIAKKCRVFPVEFVVRGYITGSTNTSMWTNYSKGVREYCGVPLPEGLVKNQKLWTNLVTPTTKDDAHDELISPAEIISRGMMSAEQWAHCERVSLELFAFGQRVAREHGLILVDTKYEFGIDAAGVITLIDEIHTPDSSRYWIAGSYEGRMAAGAEPENIDKEFLRIWFREHCDPYKDATLPDAPPELVRELSRRYLLLYEVITGERFHFPETDDPVADRIARNLA